MILVRHVMTSDPTTLRPDRSAADAAGLMEQYDIGAIPLVDEAGRLCGIVTDRDLVLRVLSRERDPKATALGDIATRATVTTTPDAGIADARHLMAEHRIRRLPVVKEERLVGMVALGDLAVADESKRSVGEVLDRVSESPSTTDTNVAAPERGTPERVRSRAATRR
jgi:CBS domain-containing protein